MADRNGYIGRAPSDSSVVVARQVFSPTGVTTDFTFASGYSIGYVDAYLNGARLIEGQDYNATNGSVVSLVSAATNGDILELVAYKAFNVATIDNAPGDLTVNGKLTVVGVTSASSANYTGSVSASSLNIGGNVTIGGTLTYEDVTNVDAIGVITARSGINVTAGGLVVTSGISTFAGITTVTGETLFSKQVNVSGIVTATSFSGTVPSSNLSGALPALDGSALTNLNIPAGFTELDAALFN